jgi:hypothetical protein
MPIEFRHRNRILALCVLLLISQARQAGEALAAAPLSQKVAKKKRPLLSLPEKLPSAGRLRIQMDYSGASWDLNHDGHRIPELLARAVQRGFYRIGTAGALERDLVESELASTDGRLWTFRFRDDVKWSNGAPFTAEHAASGLLRAAEPISQDPPEAVKRIEGYAAIRSMSAAELTGVSVESKLVLKIRLAEPDPEFPLKLLDPRTFPALSELVQKHRDYGFNVAHTGFLGPWMVTESNPTLRAKLLPNPHHHRGSPTSFRELELWIIPGAVSADQLYSRNHLDVLLGPIRNVRADGVFTSHRPSLVSLRPTTDFEMRCPAECMNALSKGLDRSVFDRLRPANSWVPPELWALQQLGPHPAEAMIAPGSKAPLPLRLSGRRTIRIGIGSEHAPADLQLLKQVADSLAKSIQKNWGVTASVRVLRESELDGAELILQLTEAHDGALDSFLSRVQGRKSAAHWKSWSAHAPRSRERVQEFIEITRRDVVQSGKIIPLGWGLHFHRMKPYVRQFPLGFEFDSAALASTNP